MSTWVWVVLVLAAWFAASVGIGLVTGPWLRDRVTITGIVVRAHVATAAATALTGRTAT